MADLIAELDAIVVELYAVPPSEFTAARTRRARETDAELAKRIRGIPKPVVAAWTVDLMAREGLLRDAIALAAELRDAQDDADAAEMTRLGRQRRQLVAALAAQGVALAADRGVSVSAAGCADIEQTLNAAMIDEDAAAAVLAARLARPIEATGFGDIDLADVVGGSIPAPGGGRTARPDELAGRRARKAAERAAYEAERDAVRAERESSRLRSERDRATERLGGLRERIDLLQSELESRRAEAIAAEAEEARLVGAAEEAEAEAQAAESRAREARAAVDDAGGRG